MSNGVEVIIAGDKSKTIELNGNSLNTSNNNNNNAVILNQNSHILRILQTSPAHKPVTLAPTTLQDQMILMMPTNAQENFTIPFDSNQFITKTCLTTYTYRTTYLQEGQSTVQSREEVISNIATEERNYLKLSPTVTLGVTLSRTPEFAVGVFHTSYTYFNTILDAELPVVLTSEYTITNTVTGPDDYISFIQPFEGATPVLDTNTYFSKITLTKTLHESASQKLFSTVNILTQVIVTESLPSRSTSVIASYYAFESSDSDEVFKAANNGSQHNKTSKPQIEATSLSTAHKEVATSSNIASYDFIPTATSAVPSVPHEHDLHIYATKTFLTTFTYLTTMLLNASTTANANAAQTMSSMYPNDALTVVNFHTRVIENVITKTVPSSLLRPELVLSFRTELKKQKNKRKAIVTLATLSGGQTLKITAMKILKSGVATEPQLKTTIRETRFSHKQMTNIVSNSKSNSRSQVQPSSTTGTHAGSSDKTKVGLLATALPLTKLSKPVVNDLAEEEDSEASGSDQQAVYISQVPAANNTKTAYPVNHPIPSNSNLPGAMNQLIGSLNLNRLSALRPVFNAMAGLLHNNFGTAAEAQEQDSAATQMLQIESKNVLKNLSNHATNYDYVYDEQPIYIPVQNLAQQATSLSQTTADAHINPSKLSPQSLHIQPPVANVAISEDDYWLQEAASMLLPYNAQENAYKNNGRKPTATYEKPLINGGIPISPGEVITANSDVIIGKPNGIQHPRMPFSDNKLAAKSQSLIENKTTANTYELQQPPAMPPTTFYQHFIQHPPYKKSSLPHANAIPFLQQMSTPAHKQQMQRNSSNAYMLDTIFKPPPLPSKQLHRPDANTKHYLQTEPDASVQLKSSSLQQHYRQQWHKQKQAHMKLLQKPQPLPQHQQPQTQPVAYIPQGYSEHKYHTIPPNRHKSEYNYNKDMQHNEIIEIVRIPEVFSTDLPPDTEYSQHSAAPNQRKQQQQLNKPHPTLLVDVQPSRITNVIIPYDHDTSELVFAASSTIDPHKYAQSYNISHAHTKPIIQTTPKTAHQIKIANEQHLTEDHSNHQKINFDTHVLSQNVDINVPPLTFKKESDFPNSVPVHGQMPKKQQQSSFYKMPLVKIPLSEGQVQVDLTPQHIIGSNAAAIVSQQLLHKQTQQQQYQNSLDVGAIGSFALHMPVTQIEANAVGAQQHVTSNSIRVPYSSSSSSSSSNNNHQSDNAFVSILQNPYAIANELHRIAPAGALNGYGFKIPTNLDATKQNAWHAPTLPTRTVVKPQRAPINNRQQNITAFKQATNAQHMPVEDQNPHSATKLQRRPAFHQTYSQTKSRQENNPTTVRTTNTVAVTRLIENNLVTPEDELNDDTTNSIGDDQKAAPSYNNIRLPTQSEHILSTHSLHKQGWQELYPHGFLKSTAAKMSLQTAKTNIPTTIPTATTIQEHKDILSQGKPFTLANSEINTRNDWINSSSNKSGNEPIQTVEALKPAPHGHVLSNNSIRENSTRLSKPNTTTPTRVTPVSTAKVAQSQTTAKPVSNASVKQPNMVTSNAVNNSTPVKVLPTIPTDNFIEQRESHNHIKPNKEYEEEIFDFHETSHPYNFSFTNAIKNSKATTTAHTHRKRPPTTTVKATTPKSPYNIFMPMLDIRPPPPPPPVTTQPTAGTEAVVGLNPPPPPPPPATAAAVQPLMHTPHAAVSTPYITINYTNINRIPLMPPPPLVSSKLMTHSIKQAINNTSTVTLQPPAPPMPITVSTTTKALPSSLSPPQPTSNTLGTLDVAATQSTSITTKLLKKTISITKTQTHLSQSSQNPSTQRNSIHPTKTQQPNTLRTPLSQVPAQHQHRANTQILRISSKRIIVPTKFITNTQILTVTSTETAVLTTAGKQSTKTLTLIKTLTTTILDTVTEIHTLLQPTQVTNSHIVVATKTMHANEITPMISSPADNVSLIELQIVATHESEVSKEDKNNTVNQFLANHKPYHDHRYNAYDEDVVGQPSIEVVLANPAVQHEHHNSNTAAPSLSNANNNSILIVMTDSKSKTSHGIINPNFLESAHNINAIGVTESDATGTTANAGANDETSIVLDYIDNITFDFPTRDEESAPDVNQANHVLLGGVLIATPPKTGSSSATLMTNHAMETSSLTCHPTCKASRSELCVRVQTRMRCVCRPGFARMFPDRPCKPTYTYAMQIPIHRLANDLLHFEQQLANTDSEDFRQLAAITHDAVDRMVMQSDFRDVYHGVHLTSFENSNKMGLASNKELSDDIIANFLLQLSDNSDEKRLVNVFKKYLRLSNYSIGGTELYTTKNGVESMAILDFDECVHSKFHDCSAQARCFNLQGTYTCSCQEGYADLSENPIYPGRLCSAEIIGCKQCHYHGKCVLMTTNSNKAPICECFAWYTGAKCQLNLKILLIVLITMGTLLFTLLLFCILVMCSKRRNGRSLMHTSMHKIAVKNTRLTLAAANTGRNRNHQLDQRAMIKDSSSETSQNSLPYVLRDATASVRQQKMYNSSSNYQQASAHSYHSGETGAAHIKSLEQSFKELHYHFPEQSDRSLTVMIPRAKYHQSILPQSQLMQHQLITECTEQQKSGANKRNLLATLGDNHEHMQLEPATNIPTDSDDVKHSATSKKMSMSSTKHVEAEGKHANFGALISAGFEVSATVGGNLLHSVNGGVFHSSSTTSDNMAVVGTADNDRGELFGNATTSVDGATVAEFQHQLLPNYMAEVRKAELSDSHESEYNNYKDGEELIDSMDIWLDTIHQTELNAEARSFDETTIEAATKSIQGCFNNQTSQTNDETNTMAERDIGSTFLLPHTHFYKPEKVRF